MKTKSIIAIVAAAFLPLAGFAQPQPPPPPPPPASPPAGPQPPAPPMPPGRHDHMPKVPMIFLGVETSTVPSVVTDQLGLAKGFGLVVDYVVPDGPAAAAGVQQNDILKMLNDQILLEPGQLRKLLQTFQEGQTVTLTILRKGQEQKISVKLTKKEMPNRHAFNGPDGDFNFNFGPDMGEMNFGPDLGDLKERLQEMKERLREQASERKDMIHDAVMKANDEVRRARDEARRAAGEVRIHSSDNGALKTTRIDMNKAQIVFTDDKGEMKIETVDGKKVLTAKDPQGKLLFSGPVESKEDLDKVPAEVRQRFDKLQQRDLPSVTSSDDEEDNDEDMDRNDPDEERSPSTEQVSFTWNPRVVPPARVVLI